MFELSVACKYLLPRWRQLSVSIISMISVLVIALVVWLIVVFFSITHGLEKVWVQKLVSLTAPVRITPTPAYYNSHYFQIDSLSAASNYSLKTIGEKRNGATDPYDPSSDEEIPLTWPPAQFHADGSPKDLVKEVFSSIDSLKGFKGISAEDFEMTFSNLRLRLVRDAEAQQDNEGYLTQAAYLISLDQQNNHLEKTLLPLSVADMSNVMGLASLSGANGQEDFPSGNIPLSSKQTRDHLGAFFDHVTITQLKTNAAGWTLPKSLFPKQGSFKALAIVDNGRILRLFVPQQPSGFAAWQEQLEAEGFKPEKATVTFTEKEIKAAAGDNQVASPSQLWRIPIVIEGNLAMAAEWVPTSLEKTTRASDLLFQVAFDVQGVSIKGTIPYHTLTIGEASVKKGTATAPQWVHTATENHLGNSYQHLVLPTDPITGEGILLPKTFREVGALVGDRGYLSYYTPTASAVQEQRIPVYVAGFYDPGIIPVGGKLVLVNKSLTTLIRGTYNQDNNSLGNGINVRFDDIGDADNVKAALQQAFKERGIDKYWNVETYREYDFTRDVIQQLQSEKNIWSLLATVIIIVACSNIISMLIILVNDKKVEIGILLSMGATQRSIAAIFGLCGMVMGVIGSLVGTVVAIVTLQNLGTLLDLIASLQGYAAFNAHFYGDIVPNELSIEALSFVWIATGVISLLAGVIPATKASLLRPSSILRKGEG
jgi:lipoprotein-releasing system permease protein